MSDIPAKAGGMAEVHAAAALFGLAGLFGRWLLMSPFIIVLGRVSFASLALGGILLLRRRRPSVRTERGRDIPLFALLGLLLAAHWVSFFRSIQVSSVAVGLLSYSTFPLFTAILEPLINREPWGKRHFLLSPGCLTGVLVIIPRFDTAQPVVQGVGWGVLAGLLFAVLTVVNRRLVSRHSALTIAFFQDLSAAVFLLPIFFIIDPSLTRRDILLLAVLGVACTALSHTLFIRGLKTVSARTASIISALEPVYGAALALLLLGEIPAARTVAGGALIVGSSVWASLAERRSRP